MPNLKRFIPATFVVLWATGFIGARYAMPWAEPFSFLFVRFALAAVILFAIATQVAGKRLHRGQIAASIAAGMLMHGVYLGGVFWAIRHGLTAGLAALIVGLQPIMTAVLAGFFLSEAILPRHWLGLAIGFVGVAVVLEPQLGQAAGVFWPVLGAAIVAVLGMSVGTIVQKRYAGGGGLVRSTAWQHVGGAALMALGSAAFETRTYTVTGELFFALAWSTLVLSIGAIALLMIMIRDGAMSKVASLFYLVPAVTAIMAWALFGESLSPVQILGMVIVTVGVGLATQEPTRARASR